MKIFFNSSIILLLDNVYLATLLFEKAKLYHKILVQVNPKYTTQICHNCSFCDTKKLQLKDLIMVVFMIIILA